ncbi:MAG: Hsp20/alpha crystallin family protein [Bacteroidales bacterium]|nr:Hsp20/alpha crystallin family protein [Bacteroidales bacterium]
MRNFNFFTSPFFGDQMNMNNAPQMRIHRHGVPTMQMPAVPPVNIAETSEGFQIEMAAPGYSKKDFAVNVDKHILTISVDSYGCDNNCEKNHDDASNDGEAKTGNSKMIYRREFSHGNFSRSFTLPDSVDTSKISGQYTDGILTLTIPKAEETVTRKTVEIL